MKLVNLISRLVVGALFIFSGLIKLNDPFGTAYKLEEYFEVFAADGSPFFLNFIPYSLFLSVLISAFEVILGAAILLYYRMKITMWISLLLIVFFTFLTYYSFIYDKVKDCGCFGTAIKLSPEQSFYKDLVLLALILILFFYKNRLEAGLNNLKGDLLMACIALTSFFIGYYTINHLPLVEPTPYKIGKDLKVLTKPKETARYEWILEKEGKEYRFGNEHYPSDTTYKYKGRTLLTDSSLLVPEIASFMIYNDEGDFTENAFQGNKFFIIIKDPAKALKNCSGSCMKKINDRINYLETRGVETMILTVPASGSSFEDYRHEVQLSGDYYYLDDTVLKTMIRSNPGIMLLKDGVIKGKWHYKDVPETEIINEALINNK